MSSAKKPTKRKSPQEMLDAVQERLDATPERLARAKEAGETPSLDADRKRRMLDPFDTMRANRVLAPQRSEAQRHPLAGRQIAAPHPSSRPARSIARGRARPARLDRLRAAPGLPQSDVALHARDKLRDAEDRVGPHAWPIVTRIVIEGAGVRDCRGFVPELATPWRADAVVSDRLRVALDMIGGLMGVTARRGRREE